jgi:hypothetical protein
VAATLRLLPQALLFDYLRLCGASHKRRYVAMSVMLS